MIDDRLVDRFALHGSVAINVILIFFLLYQLRTTPADVIHEVRKQNDTTRRIVNPMQEDMEAIRGEIETLKLWTSSVSVELVTKDQFKRWVEQAKELNPSLQIPDIETVKGETENERSEVRADQIAVVANATRVRLVTPKGREVAWWKQTGDDGGGESVSIAAGRIGSGTDRIGRGDRLGGRQTNGAANLPNGKHVAGQDF